MKEKLITESIKLYESLYESWYQAKFKQGDDTKAARLFRLKNKAHERFERRTNTA
jgi:hypothetical protein